MKPLIPSNPVLDKLPKHLFQYVHPQDYSRYTAVDQAVWRYVMRRNLSYLATVAHESYLEGLEKTGISADKIPNMYGMNRILQEIGWAAVAVDGFIPPQAFMEFQAYNVLVIAADIRQIQQIEYTPAPDIIHESAGHAPIIAIPEYAEYLRRIGEIGSKAISSTKDYELYESIRHLSILKESDWSDRDIKSAEERILFLQDNMGEPSEMALIRNLHWWTVEYGLIGTLDNPKIYGAGLLSSIGESKWCMSGEVRKLPYSKETAYQSYDITKPQPQLFVTPDFAHLSFVLEQFANTMALRKGGAEGLRKLVDSAQLGTVELSTGLQISGVFDHFIEHDGKVVFVKTKGPTSLSYREKELIGHSTERHNDGFGSPLGRLQGVNLAIEDMSPRDLEAYAIYEGQSVELHFEGDIHLKGKVVTGTRNLQGKILLVAFENCTVRQGAEVLFRSDDGIYHMAVGKEVAAAFAGPADLNSFNLIVHELAPAHVRCDRTQEQIELEALYQQISDVRNGRKDFKDLDEVIRTIEQSYPSEWLLLLELYEIVRTHYPEKNKQILELLDKTKKINPASVHLIDSGVASLR